MMIKKWFGLIKSFYQKHEKSIVSTEDFVDFASEYIQRDLTKFFEQYLEHPTIPTLLYRVKQSGDDIELSLVLKSDVKGFSMPILVGHPDNYRLVNASASKANYYLPNMKVEDFKIAKELFLVDVKKLK